MANRAERVSKPHVRVHWGQRYGNGTDVVSLMRWHEQETIDLSINEGTKRETL